MNREELEKEIEDKGVEYADKQKRTISVHEDSGYSWGQIEQAYEKGALDFAEPREKQIEQLEQENTELREKLECTEKARDYWKDSSFDWRHKCTSRKPFRAAVKAQKQLSKAKKIIKELLDFDFLPDVDVKKQAEQFLKELEE